MGKPAPPAMDQFMRCGVGDLPEILPKAQKQQNPRDGGQPRRPANRPDRQGQRQKMADRDGDQHGIRRRKLCPLGGIGRNPAEQPVHQRGKHRHIKQPQRRPTAAQNGPERQKHQRCQGSQRKQRHRIKGQIASHAP